ncbi:hypothetical protein BC834DRAFT_621711 [Gloeopeniophorella convolvens]|nr:hypothetical protein BC834DRAFT_621711 [Gloeopeniophorella convolvens]
MHLPPTSDSSRSDVVHTLETGARITIPRHPHERGRTDHRAHGHNGNTERTYYIVPPGMNVIFRDEYGNELKRVGDFSDDGAVDAYDEAPVELTDEHGRVVYKTGANYTDDGSEASDTTYRPKVVHLGQYASGGSIAPRASSPITVSLDRRGHHRHIQLEHSEDGSFAGSRHSEGSERSLGSPHMSHAQSEGHPSSYPPPGASFRSGSHRSSPEHIRLRTIYPQ